MGIFFSPKFAQQKATANKFMIALVKAMRFYDDSCPACTTPPRYPGRITRRWREPHAQSIEPRSQTASACRIRFVIASGCESSARWLASTSIVVAPMRLAMKRSRSGLIVRSWVDTA